MLASKNRIQKALFGKIAQNGVLKHTKFFSAKCFRLDKKEIKSLPAGRHGRFSIVISKKVAKTAVKRNILKRRFYSIFEKFLSKIKEPVGIIVYIKKGGEELSFTEIKKEVGGFLESLGIQ